MTSSPAELQQTPSYENSDEVIGAFDADELDFGQAVAHINTLTELDEYQDPEVRFYNKLLAIRALKDAALKKPTRRKN